MDTVTDYDRGYNDALDAILEAFTHDSTDHRIIAALRRPTEETLKSVESSPVVDQYYNLWCLDCDPRTDEDHVHSFYSVMIRAQWWEKHKAASGHERNFFSDPA